MDVHNKLIRADKDIENPYIFVSYAHKDMDKVQDILLHLRENNFRFWYDEGIGSGTDWAKILAERISNATQFLLVLSPAAILSKHVKDEIYYALQKDKAMCIVYTEPTPLPDELLLQIGRIQAVRHYWKDGELFYNSLIENINVETCKPMKADTGRGYEHLQKDYFVHERVGEGGLGVVYCAEHKRTGSSVAIKQARTVGTLGRDVIWNVYSNEREVLKRLEVCPFVPKMVDFFSEDGDIYLIENYIFGESLERKAGMLDENAVADIAENALLILQYFENNRIVHKDIKPANFKIDENGVLSLVDFGCSRIVKGSFDEPEIACGTRGYAAPEQFECYREGICTDYSTDIYGLGRTLMFLLISGSDKFVSMSEIEAGEVSLRFYNQSVSPMLEEIINKMTAEEKQDRYQNVAEVLQALKTYNNLSAIEKRRFYVRADKREKEYTQRLRKKADYNKILNVDFAQKQALEWTVISDMNGVPVSGAAVTEIIVP